MTDADYEEDLIFLANVRTQAEYLLHSQEKAARGIDIHEHSHKTKGTCGVMVIVVGNEHGGTSSKPGRDWLHFT